MGKINVKLSNNYAPDISSAAQEYANGNRVRSIQLPTVESWNVTPSVDNQRGFGMWGKVVGEKKIVGFSVCHVIPHISGINVYLMKTMDELLNDGLITQDEKDNFELALKKTSTSSSLINQLFIDAGVYTADRMNKVGEDYDIDFTYQFNPSKVSSVESTFTNLVTPPNNVVNYAIGSTQVSGSNFEGEIVYESPLGSNENYILPGLYGLLRQYMSGAITSFYTVSTANATYEDNQQAAQEQIWKEQEAQIADCFNDQLSQYENQQEAIDERTSKLEDQIEAAAKAAAEAAKKASAPSVSSDSFNIDESGDVSKWWPAYIKYQNDNQPEASDIRKDLVDGIGLDGTASILDYYNADEDENERYAVIGNTVLNEPQALKAAKIIMERFSQS